MKLKGYISSRDFMGERVPQHVQNAYLRAYCSEKKFTFFLSASEYTMNNSYIILKKTINELNNFDGLIAYSIFQMPYSNSDRTYIFQQLIKCKKKIYFAVEDISIVNENDIRRVDDLWRIKKTLKYSLNSFKNINGQ